MNLIVSSKGSIVFELEILMINEYNDFDYLNYYYIKVKRLQGAFEIYKNLIKTFSEDLIINVSS